MPIVILLDNSLSMCKYIRPGLTKRDLAHSIIHRLIDHLNKQEHKDYLGLVAFGSTGQILSEFTRDYSKIIPKLNDLQVGDCFCLEEGLDSVSDLVFQQSNNLTNIQVLLITDSVDNLHQSSIKNLCSRLKDNLNLLKDYYLTMGVDFDEKIHLNPILNEDILKSNYYMNLSKKNYFHCSYPFSFRNQFFVAYLNDDEEVSEYYENGNININGFDDEKFRIKKLLNTNKSKAFYLNELIKLNVNSTGELFETQTLDKDYVENQYCEKMFQKIFQMFNCKIKLGSLSSTVTLMPPVFPYKGYQGCYYVEREISNSIEICGFINIADLITPQTISRHYVLFSDQNASCLNDSNDFAYLIHSTIKQDATAAIVTFGDEWYGAIHSWIDRQEKKSFLLLTIFVPGNEIIQSIISKSSKTPPSNVSNLPITTGRSMTVKSYTKGCIVWYKQENLVSDLQKIIRNAKKMQDKMAMFYKELNRVRKAALSFGFYELFEGLALMLAREMTNPNNANNPETILQLNHCLNCLSAPEYKDFRKDIQPFVSNNVYQRKNHK